MRFQLSKQRKEQLRFLGIFFLIFFITAVALYGIDFVPEKPERAEAKVSEVVAGAAAPHEVSEAPTRVVIPTIGVNTAINNPTSAVIDELDRALLSGAVRYPGSARLGENAPVFLFGHQSYLPVVKNQAFKAFNGLQKLNDGDVIQVFSDTAVYEYRVRAVSLVEAEAALIPLEQGERTLVLSTCNSFGDPGERYVVTADFVSHTAL